MSVREKFFILVFCVSSLVVNSQKDWWQSYFVLFKLRDGADPGSRPIKHLQSWYNWRGSESFIYKIKYGLFSSHCIVNKAGHIGVKNDTFLIKIY